MVQKIDTGGTSKTRTPMFRFLTKVLFPESDALHITHCASVDSEHNTPNIATINAILTIRITLDVLLLRITYPARYRAQFFNFNLNASLPAAALPPDNAGSWSESCPGKRPVTDKCR